MKGQHINRRMYLFEGNKKKKKTKVKKKKKREINNISYRRVKYLWDIKVLVSLKRFDGEFSHYHGFFRLRYRLYA